MSATPSTVLVSMPFQDARRPSIQLGLLKAIGVEAGFPVTTLHAGVLFAQRIGFDDYDSIAGHRRRLLGEWLFAPAAFGSQAPDAAGRFLDDFAVDVDGVGLSAEQLVEIRDVYVPSVLDELLERPDLAGADVVGFTTTFQQTVASLALARRLKARYPDKVIVFGGANCEAEMGLEILRIGADVDYAVIGEGDTAFPEFLRAVSENRDPTTVPGVAGREGACPPRPPLTALDALPVPDYTEYFETAEATGLFPERGTRTVAIPFESARGCWWGAKHHCTFCGLNGATMQFRAKSPERVRAELGELARRHRSFRFDAVDNILDPAYVQTLLPMLSDVDFEIFYEVKANLTRQQIRALAAAGVRRIQPGIESLSSAVLALMRKGVTAGQNLNLLRWARYYGVTVDWNILWGFPGEQTADYEVQTSLLPHLVHLQPPQAMGRVWLERFSPMFTEPEFRYAFRAPEASYEYVYPAHVDVEQLAYFFDYTFSDALPEHTYDAVSRAAVEWQHAWNADVVTPQLTYRWAPGQVEIHDRRHADTAGTYTYSGPLADLYAAATERPVSLSAVHRRLGGALSTSAIEQAWTDWAQRGLVFCEKDRALALALPATPLR